ncbi:hypothetical protein SNE40_011177 [Patella caerulea]|uniref:Uncharacterized protein n=1 Tax=Patella caerulea TaxID=87958 RepID=A0AAN8PL71_PATCE
MVYLPSHMKSSQNGDVSVNVDHAVELGQKVLKAMTGTNVLNFSFKKKDQVVTLATKAGVKVDGDMIQVDPQLMFQRLIATARNLNDDLTIIFKYELCSIPPALFDSCDLPRQPNKPATYNAITQLYANYASTKFGSATIVFYGYDHGPSTKDATHRRRKSTVESDVTFTDNMVLCSRKENFLANENNKQCFIYLLADVLERQLKDVQFTMTLGMLT